MGRKKSIYDKEFILNIIYDCIQSNHITGIVKNSEVYKHALDLYSEGKIDIKLSDDYWRKPERQGTQILAEVNYQRINDTSKEIKITQVLNTEDVVEEYFEGSAVSKKKLINKLRFNENRAKSEIMQNDKLTNKMGTLIHEVSSLKEQLADNKQKADTLETVLFQFMDYSQSQGNNMTNLMNTGKTRTKPVEKMLESLFSEHPDTAYNFEQYKENKHVYANRTSSNSKDNIVELPTKKAADEFELL